MYSLGGYGNSVRGERRSPEVLQLEPDFRDFDLKTIVLAKHAQHVVLIHFTVALFTIGVLFDFLAQWAKHRVLTAAAYDNFLVTVIATIPVIMHRV